MKGSRGRTRVESFATFSMIMLVIIFVLMLWSSCVAVEAGDLCAAVRSGSLLQTGDDPVTFDIVVNRETLAPHCVRCSAGVVLRSAPPSAL